MMVSTRGRYALRVLIDLAERRAPGNVPLKEIAARQGISLKYMEGIMTTLSKAGLVEGAHGKNGGYRLTRAPEDYRVADVLALTEGSLAPLPCVDCAGKGGAVECERRDVCRTRPMWEKLGLLVTDYLNSVTLADLTRTDEGGEG